MATSSSVIVVPVSLEAVWEMLARFADVAQWARGVSQSNLLTDASSGIGAVRRVQVGRTALRETVTAWDPLRMLAYTIEGLPAIVRSARNTWTLASDGSGTSVTLTGEVQTKAGRLLDAVVARRIGSANAALLAGLEQHLMMGERA